LARYDASVAATGPARSLRFAAVKGAAWMARLRRAGPGAGEGSLDRRWHLSENRAKGSAEGPEGEDLGEEDLDVMEEEEDKDLEPDESPEATAEAGLTEGGVEVEPDEDVEFEDEETGAGP